MNAAAPALKLLASEIGELTEAFGERVAVDEGQVLDRREFLNLEPPGEWSANRTCRMVRAADGWIAANLARSEDHDLLPAWLGCVLDTTDDADPWPEVIKKARERSCKSLIADASLLGLPMARVGEVSANALAVPLLNVPLLKYASGENMAHTGKLRVIDLSTMWAGPLCGSVFAQMGADVIKVESASRPDAVRDATPDLYGRLNGLKKHIQIDFKRADEIARLRAQMVSADVVITSARPRAFDQLGLNPEDIFAANPDLVWVAVTGYGWTGEAANRVAFGDDAAAAGGLVGWTPVGEPQFLGDALADPLTGLAAASGAMRGFVNGGGVLVDAALARVAAGAATLCDTQQVA